MKKKKNKKASSHEEGLFRFTYPASSSCKIFKRNTKKTVFLHSYNEIVNVKMKKGKSHDFHNSSNLKSKSL